jgi:hypothetical protein
LSKHHTRSEKNCLNCNAIVSHRYCTVCGQENLPPQQTVGHLIKHTFNDFTHFDGKFFYSLKYLITKPGFLSQEFMLGRRMNYLDPIRFYLFTSFLFFLIMFTAFGVTETELINEAKESGKYKEVLDIEELAKDSVAFKPDSLKIKKGFNIKIGNVDFIHINDELRRAKIKNVKQFDSAVAKSAFKFTWIEEKVARKMTKLKDTYGDNPGLIGQVFLNKMLHAIPQAMFVILPLVALLLKLLYLRRKQYYYVSHVIFLVHFYIFSYINILLINVLVTISMRPGFVFLENFASALGFGFFIYLYWAMRRFYGQRRAKTILKFILFTPTAFVLIIFALVILFLLTFLFV